MNPAAQRLAKLRQTMREHNLAAWIVPSADPHLSEYLPEHWQARVYFSGFTGSVGTLVVTADKAGLWADSRYWEQAAHQLQGSGIELQKVGEVAPYTAATYRTTPYSCRICSSAPIRPYCLSMKPS